MKDIPVFTTEHGAAGLVLRQIPYCQTAYITLYDTQEPAPLLEECVGFCRACGAEEIYATGHEYLARYPLFTGLVQMERPKAGLMITDAKLVPVTADTAEKWRKLSNDRMAQVPMAAYFTPQEDKALVKDGDCYFVEKDDVLIGIGKASGDTIHTIASLVPGMGETVMLALIAVLTGGNIRLTVSQHNEKALALYARMGFLPTGEHRKWYRVK